MAGLEVAVDDEFAVGADGALRLRGAVRNSAWPYDTAGAATGNALQIDPDQGLWAVRRDPLVIDMEKSMSGGGAGIAPEKVYTYPYQQVTVANPSAVQRAAILFNWIYEWSVDIAANAIADVQGSIIRLDNRTTANFRHIGTDQNLARGLVNPMWTWIGGKTESDIEYLEPGQTSTYRIELRVLCGKTGSLKANNATVKIKGLGILL